LGQALVGVTSTLGGHRGHPVSFHLPVRGRSDYRISPGTDRASPAAPPNEIDPILHADAEDLESRAEVLRCHLLAMKDYVSEYLGDTVGLSWSAHVDQKWIEDCFRDLIADIVGPIETAAETVRQEGSFRAA
jgi:hypothetical protein